MYWHTITAYSRYSMEYVLYTKSGSPLSLMSKYSMDHHRHPGRRKNFGVRTYRKYIRCWHQKCRGRSLSFTGQRLPLDMLFFCVHQSEVECKPPRPTSNQMMYCRYRFSVCTPISFGWQQWLLFQFENLRIGSCTYVTVWQSISMNEDLDTIKDAAPSLSMVNALL